MQPPRILVLGPVKVLADGETRSLGTHLRTFLAGLVVSVNHAVRTDTLVDLVWGGDPPSALETSVHTLATKVRELLGHDALVMEDHAYVLLAGVDDIDACVFERDAALAEEALECRPARAAELARSALGLWRGPAYCDLADVDPFRLESIRLDQLRQGVSETLIRAELSVGHYTRAIPMLDSMLSEAPYREPLWAELITALGAVRRRGDAITAYRRYEAVMNGLGLEPAPEIVEALARATRATTPA